MRIFPLFGRRIGILVGFFSFITLCSADYAGTDYGNGGDLLHQIFAPSIGQETVIDLGSTSKAVGNKVLGGGTTTVDIDVGKAFTKSDCEYDCEYNYAGNESQIDSCKESCKVIGVTHKSSLLIRVTRILLMFTIVISVTMIIINGIIYIVKSGNGEDIGNVKNNLIYIVVGILLALFSALIVTFLRSVGESTLPQISQSENLIHNTPTSLSD